MAYLTLIISILSIILSILTFYWVHLRVNHDLHLVRIDKTGEFYNPRFALVNSGSKDILITSIIGRFEHSDAQGSTYPSQSVEIGEGPSMLLKSGTATQCNIKFVEEFTNAFVRLGKSCDDFYDFEFTIEVDWVDYKAHNHKASVPFAKYSFNENGHITKFSPLEAKHD